MTWDEVKKQVDWEVERSESNISLLMKNLRTGEIGFSYHADRRVVSASTIKTAIMLAVLEEVRLGKVSLQQKLEVRAQQILEDTEVFEQGASAYSVEELLTWMIIVSDNTATNVLIDFLGMERINAFCIHMGLQDTQLMRHMLDFDAAARGKNNYTSAADMLFLFEHLDKEDILTPELCRRALDILKKQRCQDQFLRYICDDIVVAHKTGGLDFLEHDVGIFYVENTAYYLGCFQTEAKSVENAKRTAGRISKLVYAYYKAISN